MQTSTPRIADGTYTYTRTNVYGPSTPTRVVIHDGRVFDLVQGEGDYITTCPAELLEAQEPAILRELVQYIRYGMVTRHNETLDVAA